MDGSSSESAIPEFERLAPGDGHYFHGFCHLQPWDAVQKRFLCHRLPFADRLPGPADFCQLGFIDLKKGCFHAFAQTTAWNFQLGSMLQWLDQDRVIYNTAADGKLLARVHDLRRQTEIDLPTTFFEVSPGGDEAAGFDMGRGEAVNPGYSYTGSAYPLFDRPAPVDEGLMIMDPSTGRGRMVISYAELATRFFAPQWRHEPILLGRILYSPGGRRLAFSARYWETGTRRRRTVLFILDRKTDIVREIIPADWNPQHFAWRDDQSLLAWSQPPESPPGFYLVQALENIPPKPVARDILTCDGHVGWFNRGKSLITDTFRRPDGYQHLYRFDIGVDSARHLGKFPAEKRPMDLRCDLHPCLSPDEKWLAVDSFHEEFRGIYLRPLAD